MGKNNKVCSGDDVRSSLDLLDRVIGEFDDGLTSGTESEAVQSPRRSMAIDRHRREKRVEMDEQPIRAQIRNVGPSHFREQSVPPRNRLVLNNQIDDIFSELTNEIYVEDKRGKNRSSPAGPATTRHVNDPLPMPPTDKDSRHRSGVDIKVTYGEDNKDTFVPLKKSVKDQVNSLETRGRQIISIKPEDKQRPTFHNNQSRSRSENPISRTRGGFTYLPELPAAAAHSPPPMPQKTKIHLKPSNPKINGKTRTSSSVMGNRLSSHNSVVNEPVIPPISAASKSRKIREVKAQNKSKAEQKKRAAAIDDSQHHRSAVAALPGKPLRQHRPSKDQSSLMTNNIEAMQRDAFFQTPNRVWHSKDVNCRQQQFRRARSMGPTSVESPPAVSPSPPRREEERRHRSRGRKDNGKVRSEVKRSNTGKGDNLKPAQTNHVAAGGDRTFLPMQKTLEELLPRGQPNAKLPLRQKSMIDLRDSVPFWADRFSNKSPMPTTGLNNKNHHHWPSAQHSSGSGKPKMVRSATEHNIKIRNPRPAATSAALEDIHMNRPDFMDVRDESIIRKINMEAQREFLLRRGFSQSHPYISGEVPIHPELQGRLPFGNASKTAITLHPEDYRFFQPELWLHSHNVHPNPISFNDVALLHNELDVRRKKSAQLQRRESQMSPFENNFSSLPWEEILPKRMEHLHHQALQSVSEAEERRNCSQEDRCREAGGMWFNSSFGKKESCQKKCRDGPVNHWLLKEKPDSLVHSDPPRSMPAGVGLESLRDSGIGVENKSGDLSRDGTERSSFSMVLKDKFQKNPNMYFPGDGASKRSNASDVHGCRQTRASRQSNASKNTTSTTSDGNFGHQENEDHVAEIELLSDADTLIHNMSDGSYERDRLSLESVTGMGGRNSVGKESGKESRVSSGNSSLSPHNSMEGSPQMLPKHPLKNQCVPPAIALANNHAAVSMEKKTIRNYTPKESSNMLREFEDRRKSSRSRQEQKSSVEQMIDDFHRNLPTPPPDPRLMEEDKERRNKNSASASNQTTNSSKKKFASKHGTISSQVSNWSVASSSAASFDYQPGTAGKKWTSSTDNLLPALSEVDYSSSNDNGERARAEGVASSDPNPSSLFAERNGEGLKSSQTTGRGSSAVPFLPKSKVLEEVQDLMMQSIQDQDDDFSNLRKLISEGRIAGLNDKPPSFTPPTPPSTSKQPPHVTSAEPSPKQRSAKPVDRSTSFRNETSRFSEQGMMAERHRQISASVTSIDKSARPRKTKEAPKPPTQQQDAKAKFRKRESCEDLTQRNGKKKTELKRSASNHGNKPAQGFGRDGGAGDNRMAQLIADSTEKKFNFNPFKGMLKKKHYSFDFN